MFCVFFSSRRRHTRYWRDWSADVCSSDLCKHDRREVLARAGSTFPTLRLRPLPRAASCDHELTGSATVCHLDGHATVCHLDGHATVCHLDGHATVCHLDGHATVCHLDGHATVRKLAGGLQVGQRPAAGGVVGHHRLPETGRLGDPHGTRHRRAQNLRREVCTYFFGNLGRQAGATVVHGQQDG